MPIDVACKCGARFRASDRLAGRRVACPRCAGALVIPAVDEALAPIQRSSWEGAVSTDSALPAHTAAAAWAPGPTAPTRDAESRPLWFAWDFSPKLSTRHVALTTVFSLAVIAGSALFMVACALAIEHGNKTKLWRQTGGQITTSELIGHGLRRRRYYAKISYAYRVENRELTSSRVSCNDMGENPRLVVRKYKQGMTLPVYYNPEDPSQAVLEPGVHKRTWYYLACSVAMAAGGILAFALCGLTLLSRLC